MKIKHSITREGCKLSGHILETIFEEGEKRGDWNIHYTKDREYSLRSSTYPELNCDRLFVHWGSESGDNKEVSYTYKSEKEAQQALDYINEFNVESTPKIEWVYVDDYSKDNALIRENKRILITKLQWKAFTPYICVNLWDETNFIKWEKYAFVGWKYAVPVPTDEKKLREIWMTDAEMEKFNELTK